MRLVIRGLMALLMGCTGEISSGDLGAAPGPGADPINDPTQNPPTLTPRELVTSPQLRRLTRAEYLYTVADLFEQAVPGIMVPLELAVGGHSTIAGAQQVGYADTNAFLEAAEKVADAVAPSLDTKLGSCADATCTRTWAMGVLAKAFRGSAEAALVGRYADLITSQEAGGTRLERLKTFVLALLSSPHFLYRKEIGVEVAGTGGALRTLTDAEIASRMSYLVWQSLPDGALSSATSLSDPAARQAQLTRMLADPKAQRGFRSFVRDWMALNENKIPSKTMATLTGTSDALASDAEKSVDLLVDDVVGKPGGSIAELLSTDRVFVNASLAPVFGMTNTSPTFQRVQLTGGQRVGLLSQPLVVGAHSKESGVSPFIMGKFILENVTCEEVGNPPATFPTVEEMPGSNKTLRQELELRTQGPACISCHARIGPVGFAFLPFDPIGRYKPNDGAGRPFDTSGTFTFERSKASIQFANSVELGKKFAESTDLKKCIARRVFRFAHGRYEGPADEDRVVALESVSVNGNAVAEQLLRDVVSEEAFVRIPVKTQ